MDNCYTSMKITPFHGNLSTTITNLHCDFLCIDASFPPIILIRSLLSYQNAYIVAYCIAEYYWISLDDIVVVVDVVARVIVVASYSSKSLLAEPSANNNTNENC